MEVRIGVLHVAKELVLDLDQSVADVAKAVDAALKDDDGVLWLEDAKGRRVGVPSARVAYVEIEGEGSSKHVGFARA
jgi:hypothetical protein